MKRILWGVLALFLGQVAFFWITALLVVGSQWLLSTELSSSILFGTLFLMLSIDKSVPLQIVAYILPALPIFWVMHRYKLTRK